MRDIDIGKRMVEEMHLEAFVDAFPLITGRTLEIVDQGESPDFEALIDGQPMGIELTQIHAEDPHDYLAEVYRLAAKKTRSYQAKGRFDARPTFCCAIRTPCPSTTSSTNSPKVSSGKTIVS